MYSNEISFKLGNVSFSAFIDTVGGRPSVTTYIVTEDECYTPVFSLSSDSSDSGLPVSDWSIDGVFAYINRHTLLCIALGATLGQASDLRSELWDLTGGWEGNSTLDFFIGKELRGRLDAPGLIQ